MATEKTKEELEREIEHRDLADEIIAQADDKYAIKLTERLMFAFIALILVAFVGFLTNAAIKSINQDKALPAPTQE